MNQQCQMVCAKIVLKVIVCFLVPFISLKLPNDNCQVKQNENRGRDLEIKVYNNNMNKIPIGVQSFIIKYSIGLF